MRIVFSAVLLLGLVWSHRYLWRRIVRDTALAHPWRRLATLVLIALGVVLPVTWAIARFWRMDGMGTLPLLAFTWMGALFYLMTMFGLVDVVRLAGRLRARFRPKVTGEPAAVDGLDRRAFFARAVAGGSVVTTAGVTTFGIHSAMGDITTPEVPVRLARLPRQLDGLVIAQMSDVHIGPILNEKFVRTLVEKTTAMKPDLVVITGDLVDGSVENLGRAVGLLGTIPSRYGTFFSTGNHEYYSDVEPWLEFLRKSGIRPLINERVAIGDPGSPSGSFDLAGITDSQGGWFHPSHVPDLGKALAGRDPERELVVLGHRPSQVVMAAEHDAGLHLAGHTHGGQIWPFGLLTGLVQPYVKGHYQHGERTQIYVSCGTGFWGPPMRILAPAEITKVVLRAG